MTEEPPVTCYRHPDRETGRRCTRCGRPACPECLQEASVGSHCVECVKEGAATTSQRVGVLVRGQNLIATKAIIGLNVIAFAVFVLSDSRVDGRGSTSLRFALNGPLVHQGDWWRIFTSSFVHYGYLHLFFNMLLLWIIGQILEPGAGPLRFTLLYVVSVIAGSAAVLLVSPHALTAGASGGVFGLAAAATLVMYRQGMRFWDTGFGPLIIINLVFDYFSPTISIAGHIGGAIGGLLAAEAMLQSRKAGHPEAGVAAAIAIGVIAFVICLVVA